MEEKLFEVDVFLEKGEVRTINSENTENQKKLDLISEGINSGVMTIGESTLFIERPKKKSGPVLSWDNENYEGFKHLLELCDLEVNRNQTLVTCDVGLFINEQNDGDDPFAHAPDILLSAMSIAERLLRTDEKVSVLKRFIVNKPVKNNVRLIVYDKEHPFDENEDSASFIGELSTNQGRGLRFYGLENENDPIKNRAELNPYFHDLILNNSSKKTQDGRNIKFNLTQEGNQSIIEKLKNSDTLLLATLLELISNTINDFLSEYSHLRLMGSLRNLVLPENIENLFQGDGEVQIQILWDTKKRHPSGMDLVRIEYKFAHQADFSKGMIAVSDNSNIWDK